MTELLAFAAPGMHNNPDPNAIQCGRLRTDRGTGCVTDCDSACRPIPLHGANRSPPSGHGAVGLGGEPQQPLDSNINRGPCGGKLVQLTTVTVIRVERLRLGTSPACASRILTQHHAASLLDCLGVAACCRTRKTATGKFQLSITAASGRMRSCM